MRINRLQIRSAKPVESLEEGTFFRRIMENMENSGRKFKLL